MNPNKLPVELRHHLQWVCWDSRTRNGKQTKVPLDPASGEFASTADPETWGRFEDALKHAIRPDVSGIGFVFTSEDPFVGVDLDDCREPETGTLTDEAVTIVTRLHSYTEISPSGTGLHVIAKGELPDGQRRRGSVEMYDQGRFFTMTGNRLAATPEQVCDRLGPLRAVHEEHVEVPTAQNTNETTADVVSPREVTFGFQVDDEKLLQRARAAKNGAKFTSLWDGNISGYDSHSEADMALCCLLAFWTGSDPDRVDELFRRSMLIRPKWDEVHYADGATYGERTVERACARVVEHYSESSETTPSS